MTPGFNPQLLTALIAACAAVAAAVLSFRASARANKIGERKIGLEEYTTQQTRYRDMLAETDRHLDRLRSQLDQMHAQFQAVNVQLAKEEDVSNSLRNQIRSLQSQVNLLEQTVSDLRDQLNRGSIRPRVRPSEHPSPPTTNGGTP